jgi:hypothetical protein
MGNVAHDLKTPLHSLEADMELLILVISKIPKFAVEKAVGIYIYIPTAFSTANFEDSQIRC